MSKYRIVPTNSGYFVERKGWFFWHRENYAGGDAIVFDTLQEAENLIKQRVYENTPRYYYPIQEKDEKK